MMGRKERVFPPLPRDVSLEDLVSKDSFYRWLEEALSCNRLEEDYRVYRMPAAIGVQR
jgi:hypothetical protein